MMASRKYFAYTFALFCGLLAVEAYAQDVRSWLTRMNSAMEALNYEGTFVHVHGGNAETLRITHRNDNGHISERIVSKDGVRREIIRRADEVRVILPNRRVVLLDETREASPLVSALPSYSEVLDPHYEFALRATARRVAERPTQVIRIRPKDEFRYGYRLWLDQDTAMPLKSQLVDENGEIIEQILFTRFEIFDFIPAAQLESTIDTAGFKLLAPARSSSVPGEGVLWQASMLPGGFALSVANYGPLAGSEHPVEHHVYSDGLAVVSVFIEDPQAEAEVVEGFSMLGSTNAFSTTVSGRKVTAIGEVPYNTLHQIAISLTAE